MRSHLLFTLLALVPWLAPATSLFAQPAAHPLALHDALLDKNFFLLTALAADSGATAALSATPDLRALAAERQAAAQSALRICKDDTACSINSVLWTDEEIHVAALALARLADRDPALRNFIARTLRPSGAYELYDARSDSELLAAAWEICARGINRIVNVYGLGRPPRYPLIDSATVLPQSLQFRAQFRALMSAAQSDSPTALFFAPSLHIASALLAADHRDEAARMEPLEAGVNRIAFVAIASTSWDHYPYTVIIVPGAGPNDIQTPLSPSGRERCRLAVEAYRNGKAPFLLVSGGYVHPAQTSYAEAIEMKRALIDEFHIPESAILVDPHARHTTTNLRNAAREIYRYGIPFNHTALVITDAAQISSIASQRFADRCLRELGYLPYTLIRQESPTAIAILPTLSSLQQDPIDPLDP